jgi:hypothetical protein
MPGFNLNNTLLSIVIGLFLLTGMASIMGVVGYVFQPLWDSKVILFRRSLKTSFWIICGFFLLAGSYFLGAGIMVAFLGKVLQ